MYTCTVAVKGLLATNLRMKQYDSLLVLSLEVLPTRAACSDLAAVAFHVATS